MKILNFLRRKPPPVSTWNWRESRITFDYIGAETVWKHLPTFHGKSPFIGANDNG